MFSSSRSLTACFSFTFCFLFFFSSLFFFFFFNDTATTEIYTLSLHDALPISTRPPATEGPRLRNLRLFRESALKARGDRKSTRLNSSHLVISYAVFCLKKKKKRARGTRSTSSTHATAHGTLIAHAGTYHAPRI